MKLLSDIFAGIFVVLLVLSLVPTLIFLYLFVLTTTVMGYDKPYHET